jgi:hypothetical protein
MEGTKMGGSAWWKGRRPSRRKERFENMKHAPAVETPAKHKMQESDATCEKVKGRNRSQLPETFFLV